MSLDSSSLQCEPSFHNRSFQTRQQLSAYFTVCVCVFSQLQVVLIRESDGQDSSNLSSLSSAVHRPGNKHGFSRLPPYGSVQETLSSVFDPSAENRNIVLLLLRQRSHPCSSPRVAWFRHPKSILLLTCILRRHDANTGDQSLL